MPSPRDLRATARATKKHITSMVSAQNPISREQGATAREIVAAKALLKLKRSVSVGPPITHSRRITRQQQVADYC